MTRYRFYGITTMFFLGLLFLRIPFSIAQDAAATQTSESAAESEQIDPLNIKVNVNEIRLDVVVVDGRGRPITDLTADDFEVYQDKLPQDVTSSVYISNLSETAAQPAALRKDSPNLTRLPATMLKEEEVNRTILFVVDNLSFTFGELYYAKLGIKLFLERQMQPGDMVSVMHTGYGNSALNMFSSDKRQISMRTDAIPLQGLPAGCYGDFAPMIYDNQLSTLSYSIRALKDMPGRKILFFVTSCPMIQNPQDNFTTQLDDGRRVITGESDREKNRYEMYGVPFERLADEALRAGVVVHSLDPRGVGDGSSVDYSAARNPLPSKTGGIYVDNNYFVDGIGNDANNMISGYYLVSYSPPPSTFEPGNKDVFNRISVRVKRRGAVVYARDGFYGRAESETDYAETPPARPLVKAILSPFKFADLNVNIAAGYIKGPGFGLPVPRPRAVLTAGGIYVIPPEKPLPEYLVRAWIHLDPEDIVIAETEDGGARIDLAAMCMTSDIDGTVHDFREVKYTFTLEPGKKSENIAWIQEHGIRFTLLLPVKKPGYYNVHISVQDAESGKVGSAYQFVEIPDLKKKGLELSNIFMITSADDLAWMRSDATKELAEGAFFPIFQEDGIRSPALRTYTVGNRLHALAMLYNADAKAVARSEIEIQSFMYKDGKEYLRGESRAVTPNEAKNQDGVSILQRLTITPDMPPGDYLLQLLATDKKNSEKRDNEGIVNQKEPGFFTRIWRAYINEPQDLNKNDKGVASQILSFTVKGNTD